MKDKKKKVAIPLREKEGALKNGKGKKKHPTNHAFPYSSMTIAASLQVLQRNIQRGYSSW